MSDELYNNEPIEEEPSVLDYVKSLLRFGGAERISLPKFVEQEKSAPVSSDRSTIAYLRSLARFPWRSLLALLLALLGQSLFEPPPPPPDSMQLGYVFFLAALSLLGWAIYVAEWTLAPHAPTAEGTDPLTYRPLALFISILLGVWALVTLGGNLFTKNNAIVWMLAVAFFIGALWFNQSSLRSAFGNLIAFFRR